MPAHPADTHDMIRVQGARENNLKNLDIEIPKRRLTAFTGVSGSGKSSLVFGTIAAESQRLINETYSAFVQGFMPTLARPDVDVLDGLTTAIIVDQVTARLTVREWAVDDADAAFRIFGDPEVTRYLPAGALKVSVEEMRRTLERVVAATPEEHPFGFWALVDSNDEVVGAALVRRLPDSELVEIGWHLVRSCWGRGLATEAAAALQQKAIADWGVAGLVALIVEGNVRSEAVAARLGMHPQRTTEEFFGLLARIWA